MLVVDRLSATRNCDEPPLAINEDHFGIVKPNNANHDSYIALRNAVLANPISHKPATTTMKSLAPKEEYSLKSEAGKQQVLQISRESTPKYQALKLGGEVEQWLQTERLKVPDFDDYLKEVVRQYPTLFETRVNDMTNKLRLCGANTKKLDEEISNINGSYRSITYYEGIFFSLREAAYDIPGGQPECGTAPRTSTGFAAKDTGLYTIKIASGSLSLAEDQLEHGPIPIYNNLFQVYMLNQHFYVDTTVYGGFGWPQVKIVRNEIEVTNPSLGTL